MHSANCKDLLLAPCDPCGGPDAMAGGSSFWHALVAAFWTALLTLGGLLPFGTTNSPLLLGSGKPGMPWARMHCAYASAFWYADDVELSPPAVVPVPPHAASATMPGIANTAPMHANRGRGQRLPDLP